MSNCHRRAAASSLLAVLSLQAAALAGVPGFPSFSVHLNIEAGVRSTDPAASPYYLAFFRPSVSGFTDPSDPANAYFVQSNSTDFYGDSSSSASTNFASVGELAGALSDPNGWTLSITDGATRNVYTYSFSVDASFLSPDYLRSINFVGLSNGADVGAAPTFDWTQDATDAPDAQYRYASAQMYNDDFSASYNSPAITPADSSWTPDDVIEPGLYTLIVRQENNKMSQDAITASMGTAIGGNGGFISDFSTSVTATSEAVAFRLAVPAPGAAVAFLFAGMAATRRRR